MKERTKKVKTNIFTFSVIRGKIRKIYKKPKYRAFLYGKIFK